MVSLVLTGFLFTQFAVLTPSETGNKKAYFAQKVNLALRRTAHHLLSNAGDDSSRIEPVKQSDDRTFLIRINRSFNYDQLPNLLKESFQVHDIKDNYDVAVLDCANGEVQLGYNFRDFINTKEVSCVGRKQIAGCYTLQVSFSQLERSPESSTMAWGLPAGILLIGLGYVVWRKRVVSGPINHTLPDPKTTGFIEFGRSSFDDKTQTLHSGTDRHKLTYREAKLLRFLISHANQVIDRDLILKSVWEDEGIIVGRSLDVFISRLRKLLVDDPTVRIVAIHGIGYRLEIQA
ncbi:hypothetical protein GCM10028805_55780 [Spirosoma harenae]